MSDLSNIIELIKKLESEQEGDESIDYDKMFENDMHLITEINNVRDAIKADTNIAKEIAAKLQELKYYNSLHLIQLINKDVDIYKMLIEDSALITYLQQIYLIKQRKLEEEQLMYLIDKGNFEAILVMIENDLIDNYEEMVEYAEKKLDENKPFTILTYDLLKNNKETYIENLFYDENLTHFCEGELSSAVITSSTHITIPCYRIVRVKFDPIIEFNESSSRIQDVIKLKINNTNYRGGIPSIFSDNPYNSFTGFDLNPRWISECIEYMVNLSMYDRLTIYAYTRNGDVIANMILRNKSDDEIYEYVKNKNRSKGRTNFFAIFFQIRKVLSENNYNEIPNDMRDEILSDNLVDSYKSMILYNQNSQIPRQYLLDASRLYAKQLFNIIDRAPPLPDDCTVYRGVSSLFYSINDKKTFKNDGFLSTSFSPVAAHQFASTNCCLKKFKIKKGTKALFMECITANPDEYEILFPPDLEFKVIRNKIVSYINIETDTDMNLVERLCVNMNNKRKINLTVMEQI